MKTIAIRAFGWLADRTEKHFSYLKEALLKAGINMLLRTYLSIAYFTSFLVFLASSIFIYSITTTFEFSLFEKILYSFIVPIILSLVSFGLIIIYPSIKVESRRRNIETNLPFAITHMSATALSGVPPSTMFRLLANFKEYGEISVEAEKIVKEIDVFGIDVTTAIRDVAKRTPSPNLREFLEGIATTIDTGGNLYAYLSQQAEKAMFEYKIRREKYLQTLSTYADFYTAVLIAAPLFLVAILSVMSMIEGKLWGMNIQDVMRLGIFIGIPIVNILFLAFVHFTQPEM